LLNIIDGAVASWGIAGLATAGVIVRPFRWPEATWAVAGAAALVVFGLLPWTDAVAGVRRGLDVYLFLIGMMLIAELARQEGLFDWLAALAVEHARGRRHAPALSVRVRLRCQRGELRAADFQSGEPRDF